MLLAAILVLAILLSGCTGYVEQFQGWLAQNSDPALRKSEPYIQAIDTENATLRAMAVSAVGGGPNGDKEYQVNKAYRYVVDQYSYYSDPRSREYIQPPYETIAIRGGDCEDLSILLCSLLENLGIRTYLVLTDNHAYCLASGVDIERLKGYARQSLLERLADEYNAKNGGESMVTDGEKLYRLTEEHESTTVRGGYAMYFGGNGSRLEDPISSVDWEYEVESSAPITVYLVPSRSDYEALCENRPFNACSGTEARNVVRLSGSFQGMGTNGGLVLKNDGRISAIVAVKVKKHINYATDDVLTGLKFTTYAINNRTCVVLDPTAGKYGYPGFSPANDTGERLAIDPVTKHYNYLG